jgi:hypothetical protein
LQLQERLIKILFLHLGIWWISSFGYFLQGRQRKDCQ